MKKLIATVLAFSPTLVFAQSTLTSINDVATQATNIGNLVIALAISLAVIWIIINVIRYLIVSNKPEDRKEGGLRILYGVIGLFVILSIWGLVYILKRSFGTVDQSPQNTINSTTNLPPPPRI